jgi:outer membrane lipoprotein-sorting protein
MNGITKFVTVGLWFVLLQSLAVAQTLTADQVMAKMEQGSQTFPFLQADIQRTKFTYLTKNESDPQSGKFWISAPGNAPRRIKIDFDKPLKELFLMDKGMVNHYYPGQKTGDTKAVKKDDQAEAECVLFGLCQPGPRIKQYYDMRVVGSETIDGVKTTRVALKPKDPTHPAGFALIELWLDSAKWYAIQTRVTESNGSYTTVKFSNIQTAKIPDSIFKLDIPRDAEITKR